MGFVIAFPGNTTKRRPNTNINRHKQADVTIFPGVRYERYPVETQKRAKPKSRCLFVDPVTQPG